MQTGDYHLTDGEFTITLSQRNPCINAIFDMLDRTDNNLSTDYLIKSAIVIGTYMYPRPPTTVPTFAHSPELYYLFTWWWFHFTVPSFRLYGR